MGRRPKQPSAQHSARAARMRARPREWRLVTVYRSSISAKSTAHQITTATGKIARWYVPAGAFEARSVVVDEGTAVYARYIGGAQ